MVNKDCEQCGKIMQARQADINRGWGRFCSKSCKAKKQTKREFYKPRDMWYYDDLEDVGHPLASGFLVTDKIRRLHITCYYPYPTPIA